MQTGTLYKPVILALVIEGIRDGEITHNRFEFDWLLPRFIERLREYGHEGADEQQLAEGFARMANDLFWLHAYRDPLELLPLDRPTPALIRDRLTHARLHEAYWQSLQQPDCQQQVLDYC
jgi:predicted restriction endonuclease